MTPAFQAGKIAPPLAVTDRDACRPDKSIFREEQDTLTTVAMLVAILRDRLGDNAAYTPVSLSKGPLGWSCILPTLSDSTGLRFT